MEEISAGDGEVPEEWHPPDSPGESLNLEEVSIADGEVTETWHPPDCLGESQSDSPLEGQGQSDSPLEGQGQSDSLLEGQGGDVPAAEWFEPAAPPLTPLAVGSPTASRRPFGVSLTLEDLTTLRAISVQSVLHRGASILRDSAGTEKTYQLSRTTIKIDVFISHNWVVPRHKKFWALVLHFNLAHATVASYVGVALGCMLDILSTPPTLQNVDIVMRPYCLILGSCVFVLALVLGHDVPLMGRLLCQRRLFLDKACINQSDSALKAAGIRSLPAFLSHSDRMLVLFQSVYVQKLWTVYELACFMYLHPRHKLDLLPVDIARVVLLSTALVMILQGCVMAGVHFGSVLGIGIIVRALCVAVLGGACVVGLAFILRRWALRQSELFSSLRSFEMSKARCANESDRPVVSSNICAFVRAMGLAQEDASEAEALQSFDRLVQESLPNLLRSAVGRTGLPYKYAVLASISIGFYSFDIMSSQQDTSANFVCAWLLYTFNMQTTVVPSTFLICGWTGNRCPQLGRWGELALQLGTAFAAVVVMLSVYLLSAFFRDRALLAAWWLLPYAALCGAQPLAQEQPPNDADNVEGSPPDLPPSLSHWP